MKKLGRLAVIALALVSFGGGAACHKNKDKKTTPTGTGGGSGSGGGSDAAGMNDGDPTNDGAGGDGNGTGTPTADGMFTSDPGPDGVVGTADDIKGTGGPGDTAGPPIVPPNLDISPEQAKTEVERHLRVARGMLGSAVPDPDGAIREAQAALAVDGTNIDAIVVIAHANYHKRLYDTAEVILDGLLEKRPTSHDNKYLYYVYGLVYDKENEQPKAFAAYKKAVALDGNFVSALVNLGVHQLANKQYRDAVETYEKLTGQLGKNDAASWNSLGSAYRGISGDFDKGSSAKDEWLAKAENAFKRAQTADKNYGPAYYNLGLLYLDADPFPTPSGPMDTLARLNKAKTYFDEYKNMPGVDMTLYDERMKDVTKLIKREEKKRAKAAKGNQ